MDILPGIPSQNHHIDLMNDDSPVYLAYSPKGGSDTLKTSSKAFEELLALGKQSHSLQATPLLRDTNPFNDLYSPANKSAEVKHYSPLKGSSWGNRMNIVEKDEEVQHENDRQDQEVQHENLLDNVKEELSAGPAGLENQQEKEEEFYLVEEENNMKKSQEREAEVEDIPTVHLDQVEDMRTPFDAPLDEPEVRSVNAPSYNGFYQEHQRAQEKIKSIQELLASAQNELKKSQARTKKFSGGNDENLMQTKPVLYPELKTSGMDFTSQAVPTMVVRTSSRDFQNDKENMRILSNIEPQKANTFFAGNESDKENRRILSNIDQNKMPTSEKSTEITKRVCSNIDNMIDKYLNDYRSPRSFSAQQQPTTFKFATAENQDGVDMMKRSNASLYNSAYYKENDMMKRSNGSLYNSAFYQDNVQVNHVDLMKRSNASLYNNAYDKENLPYSRRNYSVAYDENNNKNEAVSLDAMRFKSGTGRLETYEKPRILVTAATEDFEYGTVHLEDEEKPAAQEEAPKIFVSAAPEEEFEQGTIHLEDEERPVEKEASAKKSVNMNNFVEEKEEEEIVTEENNKENTYSDHDDVIFHDIEELNLGGQMDSPVKEYTAERIAEVQPTSPSEGREENFVEQLPVDTEEAEELAKAEKEEEERMEQEIFYSYEQEKIEDFAFPMPRNTERFDVFKVEEVNPEELEGRQGTEEDAKEMFFEEKEEMNLDDGEGVFFEEHDEEIHVDEDDKKLMGLSFKGDERQEMNLMDYYEPEAEVEKKPAMNGFQINIPPASENNFEDMLDVTNNTFFDFDRERLELTERGSIRPPVSTKRRKYVPKTIWNTREIYTQGREGIKTVKRVPILSLVFQKFDGPNAVFNPKSSTNYCGEA